MIMHAVWSTAMFGKGRYKGWGERKHVPCWCTHVSAAHCRLCVILQIAASLQAEKLILMTDVPGVLKDKDDIKTKYTALDIRSTRQLVADGIIAGGMIPK